MAYDDVIKLLGDFGPYQRRIYFLLCLPAISCALHKLANVFIIAEPNHRCQIPGEPENASYFINETVWKEYYPWDSINKKYSSCEIYKNNVKEPCEHFIFDNSVYGYTTVIEWGLTCSRTYLVANGNALFMFGVMIGSIGFGELSDRYGRKLIFFLSLILQVVAGVLTAFAPEFWSFSFIRLAVGASTSGVFLVAYVIGLEMVGPSKRPITGTVVQMFFSLGYMLVAVFAIYVKDWRYLQLALTLPGVLFFSYWWFIPESVRWLLTKNRMEEAKALIQRAAKENKVVITDETLTNLLASEKPKDIDTKKREANFSDVFRYPTMRKRAFVIFFDWFANNITYYGLSWNTNNLAGNPYINFVISGAVEIPAYTFILLALNKWGRKKVLCGSMLTAGIALLTTITIPDDKQWLTVTLAMIGKLAITAGYGTIYIFSTEQFPTVVRNAGLGASSMCARFGSILAPYINVLSQTWGPLPMVIFGCISLFGGIISLFLPETLNRKLPETMEEGEQFGKKNVTIEKELQPLQTEDLRA